ncbi:replication initiator [Streptomyces sp. NPDC090127]|uniref:replication initiator n=1 Tax=Streptomyces sp. NPDC090127 TaxID=3365953 RepID=UPI003802E694
MPSVSRLPGPHRRARGRRRAHPFAFGEQIDTRGIRSSAFHGGIMFTEGKVDGYVAKYATKGSEAATGTLDHGLKRVSELWLETMPEHAAE